MVLIITVFAALAIPTAVIQLRDRRVQEAARRIGIVYREARMRALGRGSAVLVRFAGGNMTVLEARLGTVPIGGAAGCVDLPVSSCLNTDWNNPLVARPVDGFTVPTTGELSDLTLTLLNGADAVLPALDICFTPMGRSFTRTVVTNPFGPLNEAFVARLARSGRTRNRDVALMPNGTARLFSP